MPEVTPELARQQVEKIATSEMFLNSDRLCRFLRFTVEAKLRGDASQIKEYLLGREVFDRNGEYDPRTDPIVRVEARRLRKKLDEYYAGPGLADPLRIEFPKGSYTPEFREPAATTRPRRWSRLWLAVPILGSIVLAAIFLRPKQADANTIAVIPARWIWKAENFPSIAYDVDLAERIAAELANRHQLPMVAWPAMQRFREGNWTSGKIAAELGASRSLIISVREDLEGHRVTAFLVSASTDRKIHVEDQSNQNLTTAEDRQALAKKIAGACASQQRRGRL